MLIPSEREAPRWLELRWRGGLELRGLESDTDPWCGLAADTPVELVRGALHVRSPKLPGSPIEGAAKTSDLRPCWDAGTPTTEINQQPDMAEFR